MPAPVIFKNDGRGNIAILPILEIDMPDSADIDGWDRFWREITAQYRQPTDLPGHTFYARAQVSIYHSPSSEHTGNYWAVQDGATCKLIRFAYRDIASGRILPSHPAPPLTMRRDIAASCIASWTHTDMPAF